MQRMNITLDMESNEVLSKEIEKIIEGAVKEKTRGSRELKNWKRKMRD